MPSISIITPSFNQAPHLPACLESVAAQRRAALEHLVFDPGSNDGSREIAQAKAGVTLIAEPDEGQADAVGKGFVRSKGDIIGWLNSDDEYADPGVFDAVLDHFAAHPKADLVYGRATYIDEAGAPLRPVYINDNPGELSWRLLESVGISQPAVFIRRRVAETIGLPDPSLNFAMDYDYWLRARDAGLTFSFLDRELAKSRYYPTNKTAGQRGGSYREVCALMKRRYGFVSGRWLQRLAEYEVEGHDGILSAATAGSQDKNSRIEDRHRQLMAAYNSDVPALEALHKAKDNPAAARVLSDMAALGLPAEPRQAERVELEEKTLPGKRLYTVGPQRWAFPETWRSGAVEKTRRMLAGESSKRRGDVCVVVGNGPSLNDTDLSLLDRAGAVFASNYAYMNEGLREHIDYLSVVNYLVAEQGSHEINLLEDMKVFAPYWLAYCLQTDAPNIHFFNSIGYPAFSKDANENVSWRSTVTFFNLQIAYHLGYRKVIMIGFDHNYSQDAKAVEGDVIDQTGDDKNHFDPRYFKNKKWQAADVVQMEEMYALAKAAFEEDGREIVNCTVGGHLNLFRRGKLSDELDAGGQSELDGLRERCEAALRRDGFVSWRDIDALAEAEAPAAASALDHARKTAERHVDFNIGDAPRRVFLDRRDEPEVRATLADMLNHGVAPSIHACREFPKPPAKKAANGEIEPVSWQTHDIDAPGLGAATAYAFSPDYSWAFENAWREKELARSAEAIEHIRAGRRSDTCVIVGNGPSLKTTGWPLLDSADVMISNFAYYEPELLTRAAYLTAVNPYVMRQAAYDLPGIRSLYKFFPISLSPYAMTCDGTFWLNALLRPEFSFEAETWISWRSTVSFFNMQLAASLGYSRILLTGFDHSYTQAAQAKEGDLIMQTEADVNHFRDDYFRGKVWQAADTAQMESVYEVARDALNAKGVEIVNCTAGGKLETFPRGSLEDLLGGARR